MLLIIKVVLSMTVVKILMDQIFLCKYNIETLSLFSTLFISLMIKNKKFITLMTFLYWKGWVNHETRVSERVSL